MSENSADVFYEWPLVLFTVDEVTKASKDIESTAYPALTAQCLCSAYGSHSDFLSEICPILFGQLLIKEWRLKKETTFAFGQFTTISGHFFGNYINIFHKTEVQMVILRC